MTTKKQPIKLVQYALDNIPDFEKGYTEFEIKTHIEQKSHSLIKNYSRCIAAIAIHYNKVPQELDTNEVNHYLYKLILDRSPSLSYFKHTIYGLRYWFRLFGLEEKALLLPAIKRRITLPAVLSKEECKSLFRAPSNLKHRYLLAFIYSAGLRLNEIRNLKLSEIDTDRKQLHIRNSKGRKDRYVVLSDAIASRLENYLSEFKPLIYLFEGYTPGVCMGAKSLQYIIYEAVKKTDITKKVSLHTLRHSFATHLMEDGLDMRSIQHQLGHSDIRSTLKYLHIVGETPKKAYSPLDTLYGWR